MGGGPSKGDFLALAEKGDSTRMRHFLHSNPQESYELINEKSTTAGFTGVGSEKGERERENELKDNWRLAPVHAHIQIGSMGTVGMLHPWEYVAR